MQSLFMNYIHIFTVTNKLLSILLYNKNMNIKYMNNVKVVHVKETIMTSFLKKQSPKSIPNRTRTLSHRNTLLLNASDVSNRENVFLLKRNILNTLKMKYSKQK